MSSRVIKKKSSSTTFDQRKGQLHFILNLISSHSIGSKLVLFVRSNSNYTYNWFIERRPWYLNCHEKLCSASDFSLVMLISQSLFFSLPVWFCFVFFFWVKKSVSLHYSFWVSGLGLFSRIVAGLVEGTVRFQMPVWYILKLNQIPCIRIHNIFTWRPVPPGLRHSWSVLQFVASLTRAKTIKIYTTKHSIKMTTATAEETDESERKNNTTSDNNNTKTKTKQKINPSVGMCTFYSKREENSLNYKSN